MEAIRDRNAISAPRIIARAPSMDIGVVGDGNGNAHYEAVITNSIPLSKIATILFDNWRGLGIQLRTEIKDDGRAELLVTPHPTMSYPFKHAHIRITTEGDKIRVIGEKFIGSSTNDPMQATTWAMVNSLAALIMSHSIAQGSMKQLWEDYKVQEALDEQYERDHPTPGHK